MNKLAILLTALLISSFAAVKLTHFSVDDNYRWLEHEAKVRDMTFRYDCFKETLEAAIDDLEANRTGLKAAQSRVHAAASFWYPKYLQYLGLAELGASDEERVARNLVNHVASNVEIKPHLARRVRDLEVEFERIFGTSKGESRPSNAVY